MLRELASLSYLPESQKKTLGVPRPERDRIVPISENEELIKERTGVADNSSLGTVFNMTLRMDDIVGRFGVTATDGVGLLVMSTVRSGGSDCMCGANALLRVLYQHLLIQRGVVIMDMEAARARLIFRMYDIWKSFKNASSRHSST